MIEWLLACPLGLASNWLEVPFPECYAGWLTRDPDGSPNGETSEVAEGLVGFSGIGHLDSTDEFQVPAFFIAAPNSLGWFDGPTSAVFRTAIARDLDEFLAVQ